MVDQLELVWSAETDSNSMVIGLLLAAKHAASLYGSAVRVLLFLRADIYDSLHFGEGDKFRGDELRITWTEQALRDLALARARASAGADLTSETLWGELFPAAVEGEETATYLFRRCLPRPRDAIQFLNLCQETASLIHGRDRITEADVVQAGRQFSDWKLKDLALEYLVAHPFLKHLFPLFQNTGYVVTRAVLATRFQAAAESLHRLFPAYADALTVPGVVDVLYAVGFLGVRRGNDVVFAGGDDLPAQFHETEFHVHPCFRAALGATSAIDLRHFEIAAAIGRVVQGGNQGGFNNGTFTSAPTRDHRLVQDLRRSCHSILAQTSRALTLAEAPATRSPSRSTASSTRSTPSRPAAVRPTTWRTASSTPPTTSTPSPPNSSQAGWTTRRGRGMSYGGCRRRRGGCGGRRVGRTGVRAVRRGPEGAILVTSSGSDRRTAPAIR